MPQYLAPGVFIEEIAGPKSIEGVGTATAGFIGLAEKGPVGEAVLITNRTQFAETFGGFIPQAYLPYAVNQFFDEGGTRCYVVRTCHYDNNGPTAAAGTITIKKRATTDALLKIDALSAGSWSDDLWVEISDYDATKDPASVKFRLAVRYRGVEVEPYEELTMSDVESRINGVSKYITVTNLGTPDVTSANRPQTSLLVLNARGTATPCMGMTALDTAVSVVITDQQGGGFNVIVKQEEEPVETFANLGLADIESKINGVSKYIKIKVYDTACAAPAVSETDLLDTPVAPETPKPTLRIRALVPDIKIVVAAGSTSTDADKKFKLAVQNPAGQELEAYDDKTMANIETAVNGVSTRITVTVLTNTHTHPANLPASGAVNMSSYSPAVFALDGGWDGLIGTPLVDREGRRTLDVSALTTGVTISVADELTPAGTPANTFKLTVKAGSRTEEYPKLTMATVEHEVNGRSQLVEVNVVSRNPTLPPKNRPAVQAGTVVGGGLTYNDFTGDQSKLSGLFALDLADDVNIIAIPDRPGDRDVTLKAYTYCENRKDCFFVADPPPGLTAQSVLEYKKGIGAIYAGNAFNSSYAALYYPWIAVSDPLSGKSRLVPPSGAVAGTYSATDVARGVHKAPAGTIDGYLNSAVGIERIVTKGEQESLNPELINVIRSFPGAGIVVWGARTLSADPAWRYVSVRRLLLFIEKSIDKGSQWVVFEPNDRSLWGSLKRDLSAFLKIVWKSGALFGSTAEEAFFVKIDDENNPPEMRDAGRLNIDIGVAPVKPAEFVVFRISQKTAGAK